MFDVHSLRHQFISSLVAAGVHLKDAQSLACHSTIALTIDRYTHVRLASLSEAVGQLPDLPGWAPQERGSAAATGTHGAKPIALLVALPIDPPRPLWSLAVPEVEGGQPPRRPKSRQEVRQWDRGSIVVLGWLTAGEEPHRQNRNPRVRGSNPCAATFARFTAADRRPPRRSRWARSVSLCLHGFLKPPSRSRTAIRFAPPPAGGPCGIAIVVACPACLTLSLTTIERLQA